MRRRTSLLAAWLAVVATALAALGLAGGAAALDAPCVPVGPLTEQPIGGTGVFVEVGCGPRVCIAAWTVVAEAGGCFGPP